VSILIQGQLQLKRGCPKSRKTIEDLLISRTSNFTLRKEKVSLMKRKNLILHLNGSKQTLKGVHSEIIPTASENFDYILSVSDRVYHSKKLFAKVEVTPTPTKIVLTMTQRHDFRCPVTQKKSNLLSSSSASVTSECNI
jgi:hypothetical protein